MSSIKIGTVLTCTSTEVTILVEGLGVFEDNKASFQIGRYIQIAQGNHAFTIAIIRNIHGSAPTEGQAEWRFTVSSQPIGNLGEDGRFEKGAVLLPVPTEPAFIPEDSVLQKLFTEHPDFAVPFGKLSINPDIEFRIDGNKLFSKHLAIVGSTGSGKSCAVARILQDVVGINSSKNARLGNQNNAHLVMFDLHDEYPAAFSIPADQSFTRNCLNVESLLLPYWLMNSEELESMFIESNEQNSHNQVSQFKLAVIQNKERHNPSLTNVNYDTPVYFSLQEVYNYIENLNREVIGRLDTENLQKLQNGALVKSRKEEYFETVHTFVTSSTAAATKASNGPFHGEFNRFLSRLETKISDRRLEFLLHPRKPDTSELATDDFELIIQQFLGYISKANVTIIDLGGVPFEVLSITVSLVSRLIFDFCFHYTKLQHALGATNNVPVMLICEEAHNYIPRDETAAYRASRKSIERIAKEGRKYGLSLMVVSQRPSEVSETIFSQCSNFVALRLTNETDQSYVKGLFPDNSRGITDILPNLAPGECLVVGDAVLLPSVVQLDLPDPEPHSKSVLVHNEWQEPWREITFKDVVSKWRSENAPVENSEEEC
jgi:DNA helicase HerA-like ATPase